MNRRLGTVAIVLMALTALAALWSFVFFSQPVPNNSAIVATPTHEDSSSTSNETINPDPSEPPAASDSLPLVASSPRADQPANLKPQTPSRSPDWKLLDWSVKSLPEKPGTQLRASSYQASGKYPFVRVEQEIEVLSNGEARVLKTVEMVGDQIIVKLPEGAPAEEIHSLAAKLGGQAATKPFAPDTWLVALPRKLEAVPEALTGSTNSGISIDYAEPNHLVRPMRTPNDPRFTNFSQWHLYNNTQIDKDIKAPRAWDRRTSAAYGTTNKVIVAVIDSGVRYTHEDLLPNMWTNPGEISGDGIDNDGNGLIDDVYGADYVANDGDPMTVDSHGTHCAGLIAGVGNNGLGITGVAWSGTQIMALRFIEGINGSLADAIQCIDYAIAKGARVINASYGFQDSNGGSSTEANAIGRAQQAGIVFVAAAGNDGTNNDNLPFYPASYTRYFPNKTLENIIAVGATDRSDGRASFSNYGATSVDLMAPGVEMWSTSISGTSNSHYTSSQGTSFAAPVVAGAVALLIAEYPNDTVAQRVARVVNTNAVDVIPALSGLCVTGGRLNLAKLLPAADVNTLPQALAWHRPNHTEDLINSAMRTPATIALSNNVTVFTGIKKFNNTNGVNTYGLANQTGGWLFYRTSSAVSWSSNSLAWHTNNGDYQFWKGVLSNVPARTFEYYLQLDFDSGARTTYSYYTNNADGFATTTNQATAQSSPYTFTVPKAAATLILSGTNQTYNGSARPVSVSTTPSGLSNTVTYNGSSSAPTNAGTYTVVATVTDSNYEGSATNTLTISKASATISLGNLNQTYDGTARSVTPTTTPSGLATSLTYNGSSLAPTNAGTYTVVATITDSNYQGSVTNTLTVAKAAATLTLGNTSQTYDGSTRSVTATTTPPGLNTSITYDGVATAPVNAGSYAVVATVNDSNYSGSASESLQVAKASATVSLSGLSHTYDGSAKSATASTSPGGLTVDLTYDGSVTSPTNAGTYPVVATVNEPNYEGSASGTLVVGQASQSISFTNASTARVGEVRSLSASATSGLPVAFTSSDSSIAPVLGTQVTFGAPGEVLLTASQAGNGNYLAASNVAVPVSVSGIPNPSADNNGDGIPNLVEYALATNSSGSILPILTFPSNGVLALTAIVRTNDLGLGYTAHGVTNLLEYTNTNSVSSITGTPSEDTNNVPSGFQKQEFRYTNNASRAFLKLTIEQQ